MRFWVTPLFLILFGLWFASHSYMGLNLYGHNSRYALYLIVLGVLTPALVVLVRDRRWEWRNAAIAIVCVICGQIIWRDYVHVLPDFKVYGDLMQQAQLPIMALGIFAGFLEWHAIRKKAAPV